MFNANSSEEKAGVAIQISDKRDFKTKIIKIHKEGHCMLIKESIHQ